MNEWMNYLYEYTGYFFGGGGGRVGQPPDDGEMNEMTLPSRHRIRNSNRGCLRPNTLPLVHGGSTHYWIFTIEGMKHLCFSDLDRKQWTGGVICITFIQRGPTLYKCNTNVLCLLGFYPPTTLVQQRMRLNIKPELGERLVFSGVDWWLHSERWTLTQCCCNVAPPSMTLSQHYIVSMFPEMAWWQHGDPADARHSPNADLMLVHRLRHRSGIKPTLGQCLVVAGKCVGAGNERGSLLLTSCRHVFIGLLTTARISHFRVIKAMIIDRNLYLSKKDTLKQCCSEVGRAS